MAILADLAGAYDTAFIVISDAGSLAWIAKELHVQHSLGRFKNVRPAFPSTTDIPARWRESGPESYTTIE